MKPSLKGMLVLSSLLTVSAGATAQDTPAQPHTHPPSGAMPPTPSTSVAPPPASATVQLEYRGQVSDVWEAPIRKKGDDKENKVVLVETDQGQVVLADLGPSDSVKVEEGSSATVTGEMMNVEGTRRFVPQTVQVGTRAAAPAPANAQVKAKTPTVKRPQKQQLSGKIIEKEKMNAKQTKIDHQLAVLEISAEQRVLVDLGPSAQLEGVELDEGDRVKVEGQSTQVNQTMLLIADKVQKGDKKVSIQREAMPSGKAALDAQGLAPVPQPK